MRITSNYNQSPSFGTCQREYSRIISALVKMDVRTTTWARRQDLSWNSLFDKLNEIFKDKPKVNFYILGCSDGTEAFCSAKMLRDKLGKDAEKFLPIKASDIDKESIRAAKSGMLKLEPKEAEFLSLNPSKKNLVIKDDVYDKELPNNPRRTYDVSRSLKKAVKFQCSSLINVLNKIEDDSNTIVMCRNVFWYVPSEEKADAMSTLSKKLKGGSLFVKGDFDDFLFPSVHGFRDIMQNVWQKK